MLHSFVIQRLGSLRQAVSGRLIFVTSSEAQAHENVPKIAQAQRPEVLCLPDLAADVRIGDLVTLPASVVQSAADGCLRRVIQVRRYSRSLQVGLQRVPFSPLALFLPKSQLQRTTPGTLKVSDVSYAPPPPPAPPTLLGYFDPAPDAVKLAAFGKMDTRAAFLYSLVSVPLGAVVQDTLGDTWIAELPSDVWPLPGDYKTLMRHLITPPAGVTLSPAGT